MPAIPAPPESSSEVQATETVQAPDSLAVDVTEAYSEALDALPGDLTPYERRVATGEVATLIRVRFGLSPGQFRSMLTSATP